MNEKYCQSCGMPMGNADEMYGSNVLTICNLERKALHLICKYGVGFTVITKSARDLKFSKNCVMQEYPPLKAQIIIH